MCKRVYRLENTAARRRHRTTVGVIVQGEFSVAYAARDLSNERLGQANAWWRKKRERFLTIVGRISSSLLPTRESSQAIVA